MKAYWTWWNMIEYIDDKWSEMKNDNRTGKLTVNKHDNER